MASQAPGNDGAEDNEKAEGDRPFLTESRLAIEAYLANLRLQLHPATSQLFETQYGVSFVGFRVLSDRICVRNDNLRRARRRFKRLRCAQEQGHEVAARIGRSRQSWLAHLEHGNTWRLRQKILTAPYP